MVSIFWLFLIFEKNSPFIVLFLYSIPLFHSSSPCCFSISSIFFCVFILLHKYCKNASEFVNTNFFILFLVVSENVPVLKLITKLLNEKLLLVQLSNSKIIPNFEWENRGNTISRHFTAKPQGVTVWRRELRSSLNKIRIGTAILRLITSLHGSVRGMTSGTRLL